MSNKIITCVTCWGHGCGDCDFTGQEELASYEFSCHRCYDVIDTRHAEVHFTAFDRPVCSRCALELNIPVGS